MEDRWNMKRWYYILDHAGNYYRINEVDELVSVSDKNDAGVFSDQQIQEKVGNGKRSRFYRVIEADDTCGKGGDQTMEENKIIVPSEDVPDYEESWKSERIGTALENVTDPSEVDWVGLLRNLSYINSMIPAYKDQLRADQNNAELYILDILHFIELCDYDDQKAMDVMEQLKEAREKRRLAKDELFRVERYQNSIGTSANTSRIKQAIEEIGRAEKGNYHPRVAVELFENYDLKPRIQCKCYADRGSTILRSISSVHELSEEGDLNKMEYEYERIGTVYDDKKTDWLAYVRSQKEFFGNAQQHIADLQFDLAVIDTKIEEMMLEIEDANYNAVQGYHVFQKLKELRNQRKEMHTELRSVQMIVDRFDCRSMLDAYEDVEAEMVETVDARRIKDLTEKQEEFTDYSEETISAEQFEPESKSEEITIAAS